MYVFEKLHRLNQTCCESSGFYCICQHDNRVSSRSMYGVITRAAHRKCITGDQVSETLKAHVQQIEPGFQAN